MPRIELVEPYAVRLARQSIRDSLDDVSPPLATPNFAHGLKGETGNTGQFGQGHVVGSDQPNGVFGDLGVGVLFAGSMTPSFNHVSHVFDIRTCSEMSGLNTDGTITGMQDVQTVGDFAVIDAVSNPAGQDVGLAGEQAVAISVRDARPVPASFGGRISGHEPRERFGFSKPSGSVLFDRPAVQDVAMPSPASVMSLAPPPSRRGVVAVLNGAGGVSHAQN